MTGRSEGRTWWVSGRLCPDCGYLLNANGDVYWCEACEMGYTRQQLEADKVEGEG